MDETLIRRDGSTGKPIWDAARPARPWSPERDPVAAMRRLSHFGDAKRPGELVQPAPDLDRRWHRRPRLGHSRHAFAFWLFRARTGRCSGRTRPIPAKRGRRVRPMTPNGPGRIVGAPASVDVDGDGTMDLIAEFAVFDDPDGARDQAEPE